MQNKFSLFICIIGLFYLSVIFAQQETLDVGVTRIIAPGFAWIDSGTVVTPRAMVRNFGNVTASFPTIFRIGTFYNDTQYVNNLNPGDSIEVSFTPWTALQRGTHTIRCSTALTGDMNPTNNARSGMARVRVQDVGVVEIVSPVGIVDSGAVVIPQARVANYGTGPATFSVTFKIGDFYSHTRNKSLFAGITDTVNFPSWTANEIGTHIVLCSTALTGDLNPFNNTLSDSVIVSPLVGILDKNIQLFKKDFVLDNSPNPFFFSTIIRYGLPKDCKVNLEVYNSLGVLVKILKRGIEKKGFYSIIWDGRNEKGERVGKGIYFLKLSADEFNGTKKIIKLE
ncbi:MAG: T9SS type A sorting domain-containing protein [candidate division WOR-3 bacterium]|nr:T9SS type A sorting domain-containing protein [candidate division WOR-3 bacterium]